MSAIEKDRAIAAASIGGTWSTNPRKRGGTSIDVRVGSEIVTEAAWAGDLTDAEHIVRLHNRQPLYDALVVAVREYKRTQFEGAYQERLRAIDQMSVALSALDTREEKR